MSIPHVTLTGVKEDSTAKITGVFKDEAGVAIDVADLFTVRMWLKSAAGATINSRADVNIKNTGPATIDSSGNFALKLSPDDNPFLGGASDIVETHILTIEWTWNGGADKSHMEIHLKVENSTHVPTA